MKWMTDILTDANGDHAAGNHIAIWGGIAGLGMQLHAYFIHGAAFDLQNFGIGLGTIVAALGAAQRLRGDAGK